MKSCWSVRELVTNALGLVMFSLFSFDAFATSWDSIASDSKTVWKDESGKDFRISDIKDKNLVLTMLYTNCRKTCPALTLKKLGKIQEIVDLKKIPTQFVLITFDPVEDTQEVLHRFKDRMIREKISSNANSWHFLRGSDQETRQFADRIGLGDYWKMEDHIQHSFKILYFDRQNLRVRTLDHHRRDVETLFE